MAGAKNYIDIRELKEQRRAAKMKEMEAEQKRLADIAVKNNAIRQQIDGVDKMDEINKVFGERVSAARATQNDGTSKPAAVNPARLAEYLKNKYAGNSTSTNSRVDIKDETVATPQVAIPPVKSAVPKKPRKKRESIKISEQDLKMPTFTLGKKTFDPDIPKNSRRSFNDFE